MREKNSLELASEWTSHLYLLCHLILREVLRWFMEVQPNKAGERVSKLGQMHHEELGQCGRAAWFHPAAEVSRSSSSFTGSITVTETECKKSCTFGPFHLNSAKTKKLGHNDGSLNKGKQPQKKQNKTKHPSRYTWCSWQVCPMLKSTQGPSLQLLFGWDTNAAASTRIREPVAPDWEYSDVLLTGHLPHHPKLFVHSLRKLTVCPTVCKAAGDRHPPGWTPAKERLIVWTGCDQGSGFNDYTINVSACTPGPLWPGGNPTPQLLKRPDPSARTLHS